MGVLGPRRVQVDKDGNPTELPVKLIDNEYTLLASTDMVFIDPVGTGYSTAAEGANPTAPSALWALLRTCLTRIPWA